MENLGRNRLDNWDKNKAEKEFYNELYGDAGVTDFSDEAKKRLEEGAVYEDHLRAMTERSESTGYYGDADDQEKARQEYEAKRNNPRVRSLFEFAEQINRLRNQSRPTEVARLTAQFNDMQRSGVLKSGITLDNFLNTHRAIQSIDQEVKAKEDTLNRQLAELTGDPTFDTLIIDDIIDATNDPTLFESQESSTRLALPSPDQTTIDKPAQSSETEDEAEAELVLLDKGPETNEVVVDRVLDKINNPSTSKAEKLSLVERIRKSVWFRRSIAFVIALGVITGFGAKADFADQNVSKYLNNQNTVERSIDGDYNYKEAVEDRAYDEAEADGLDFESIRYSSEYQKHNFGDEVKFSAEAKKILDQERKGEYDIYPGIQDVEDLKRAAYQLPEVIAGLAMYDLDGFKLTYIDANGNEAVADTVDEINEAIRQMKNDPKLFGKNYDAFLNLINSAQMQETTIKKGTFNVYRYFDRNTGEEKMAIGAGDGGEALEFTLESGQKLIFLKGCVNIIVLAIKDKVPIIIPMIQPDEKPDKVPETIPKIMPKPTPKIPPTENELNPKDPTKDINVNPELPDQLKMGDQRVDDGGYRPAEDVTKETYEAPVEPENIIDEDLIKEINEMLDQKEEALNQSYENETPETQKTLDENQTGQGEVNRPYQEVETTAEPADTGNQQPNQPAPPTNEGRVSGF